MRRFRAGVLVKSALLIGVGLLVAGIACNPEQSLTEVLKGKSCSDAGLRCVPPYLCDETKNICVMPDELPDAGVSSANAIDDPSPAGGAGAPQQVGMNLDPVGGQGGAAGSESAAAGAGGVSSSDPPAGEVDAGCATKVELFRDLDGDGYGSAASGHQTMCPQEGWVERGDDCFDEELTPQNRANLVHPEQTEFFVVGYLRPDQSISFDYDCSLQEEPDPASSGAPAAGNCAAAAPGSCGTANGFVVPNRSGDGINRLCGSTEVQICMALDEQCVLGARGVVDDPFQCH